MVLENKLGITSSSELANTEEKISKKKALELFELGILDNLQAGKFETLASIHEYLFNEIYDFAGKIRTVDIAKGNMFCNVRFISSQADVIFSGLKEEHYLAGLDEDMEKIIAKCIKKK